jgi:SnoaL-like domain
MMNGLKLFLAYAAAFESTVRDDDWERIRPFFAADAVYEVDSRHFGARLVGPDAICVGIRRSLGGFDRRFASRRIEPIGTPERLEDGCRIEWKAHYDHPGVERVTLRGISTARFREGKIALLSDQFAESDEAEFLAWQARNPDFPVDFSYVG